MEQGHRGAIRLHATFCQESEPHNEFPKLNEAGLEVGAGRGQDRCSDTKTSRAAASLLSPQPIILTKIISLFPFTAPLVLPQLLSLVLYFDGKLFAVGTFFLWCVYIASSRSTRLEDEFNRSNTKAGNISQYQLKDATQEYLLLSRSLKSPSRILEESTHGHSLVTPPVQPA